MPTNPGPPLQKITLNLYEADVIALELRYGRGWSAIVRDWVNQHIQGLPREQPRARTLGDIHKDPSNGR